jgi:hypothetical protein
MIKSAIDQIEAAVAQEHRVMPKRPNGEKRPAAELAAAEAN